jgi:hypothetical protein
MTDANGVVVSGERKSPGRLHQAALIALVLGTAGTVGLFLRAGQRTPRLLLVLMGIWVLAPFAALACVSRISTRWSTLTRGTLDAVTLAVTLGSLAIYTDDALAHRTAHAAFVWVMVPPTSSLLAVIAIAAAALVSRRRARGPDAGKPVKQ